MEPKQLYKIFSGLPRGVADVTPYAQIREKLLEAAHILNGVLPECREKALAFTALQQARMWADEALSNDIPKHEIASDASKGLSL